MNGVWGLACNLNPSLKQAQEVGASPVQGKGGSLLPKHVPDRTRLCALAPATALSRHRLGSAKDKKQKEQMQRQMVGIVKGTSCPCPQNQVGGSMGGEAHFAKPCLWCPLPGTAAVLAGDF